MKNGLKSKIDFIFQLCTKNNNSTSYFANKMTNISPLSPLFSLPFLFSLLLTVEIVNGNDDGGDVDTYSCTCDGAREFIDRYRSIFDTSDQIIKKCIYINEQCDGAISVSCTPTSNHMDINFICSVPHSGGVFSCSDSEVEFGGHCVNKVLFGIAIVGIIMFVLYATRGFYKICTSEEKESENNKGNKRIAIVKNDLHEVLIK